MRTPHPTNPSCVDCLSETIRVGRSYSGTPRFKCRKCSRVFADDTKPFLLPLNNPDCPLCGNVLRKRGFYTSSYYGAFQRYRCTTCHSSFTDFHGHLTRAIPRSS